MQKCVYAYHLLELFDALLDLGLFHGVLEDVGIDAGREDVDRHHVAVPFHTLSNTYSHYMSIFTNKHIGIFLLTLTPYLGLRVECENAGAG